MRAKLPFLAALTVLLTTPPLFAADHPPAKSRADHPAAKLDPQMKAVLDEFQALGPKAIETLSPDDAREQPTIADAVMAVLKKRGRSTSPEQVADVDDRSIDGPGGAIPVRVYTPEGTGPFPVVVYYHGGGWVIADLDVYDATPRALANAVGAVVVSVHYRQAPEHKFPAAAEDAFAAYRWVLANCGEINGNPDRIAVAGESAGGNLATVTAMMARDKGVKAPAHQLLVYPVTNHRFDTESYREHATAKPLNKPMMEWFWGQYLANPADGMKPYASPLMEKDLSRLPAATVVTADIDPLMSEGKAYADKLKAAGVDVSYKNFEGVTHEFFGTGAAVDKAKEAVRFAAAGLRSSLEK